MAEVLPPSIPQREIQHAALERDIRAAPTRTELEGSRRKSAVLDSYRDELLFKVNAHLDEIRFLDESRERTSVFKAEMLGKVEEHMAEMEREEAREQSKREEVAQIKGELVEKVHRHAEELERMDARRKSLATYKSELLVRAGEHVRDVELAREKGELVRRFSLELGERTRSHEAHLAERAEVAAALKREIIKEVEIYYIPVTQREIQRAALERDIRAAAPRKELEGSRRKSRERTSLFKEEMLGKVNEQMAELEREESKEECKKEESKKEVVAHIKGELLDKVHDHAKELEKRDRKRKSVAMYKSELLSKAEEHGEVRRKRKSVAMYKSELLSKAEEHSEVHEEKRSVAAALKNEIIKDAES